MGIKFSKFLQLCEMYTVLPFQNIFEGMGCYKLLKFVPRHLNGISFLYAKPAW